MQIRRATFALSTLVEVTISANDKYSGHQITTEAFQEIYRLEKILSHTNPLSNLAEVNNAEVGKWVSVPPELAVVLRLARWLFKKSNGLFDVSVASDRNTTPSPTIDFSTFQMKGCNIKKSKAITLNLGGIAKGFIVDTIVKFLRSKNIGSGVVNAGGDLRVFGTKPAPINIRSVKDPKSTFQKGMVTDGSVSTSSGYERGFFIGDKKVQPIFNKVSQTFCSAEVSATIIAPSCWFADALTKILLCDKKLAEALLTPCNGEWILERRDAATTF